MDLSLLLAIAIVVGLIIWLRRRSQRGRVFRSSAQRSVSGGRSSSVSGPTRRELLRLVHGNQAVAQRLVSTIRHQNPGRSEQWCWEKAIYDIQRDRRS